MRLRKNLKRTAAAAMALGMAVSTAAPAATAAYYVKVDSNTSNVTVVKDEHGNVTVTKDGETVSKTEDDSDDVIIYGDEKPDYSNKNTGSSTSGGDSAADAVAPQPAEEEGALPVNTDEEKPEEVPADTTEEPTAEAPEETTSESDTEDPQDTSSVDETPTTADGEGEQAGTAPTEDTGSADDSTDKSPAPEQSESEDKTEDKPESDPEAETPKNEGGEEQPEDTPEAEGKTGGETGTEGEQPVDGAEQPAGELPPAEGQSVIDTLEAPSGTAPIADDSKDEEEKTYLEKAADSFSEVAERAVTSTINAVINIINKATGKDNALNITLNNVKINASSTDKAAMTVEGEGDVNIELDGKNELTSDSDYAGLNGDSTGTLTIKDDQNDDGTAKNGDETDTTGELTATGGSNSNGDGGDGIRSGGNLVITGGNITAIGGSSNSGTGGNGIHSSGSMEISGGTIEKAQGGDTSSNGENTINSNGISSYGTITINGKAVIKNAIGGKGRYEYWFQGNGIYSDAGGVTIGGSARVENAQGGSGGGGAGIVGDTKIRITDKAYVKARQGSAGNLLAFIEKFTGSHGSVLYGRYANAVVDQKSNAYAVGYTSDGEIESYGEYKSESHGRGHIYSDWTITNEPTCTESGKKTSTCDVCGAEGGSETIPATGHKYEEVIITAPTCTTEGSKHLVCSVCGDEKSGSTQAIAKLEHQWDEGKITTSATCGEAGVKTFTCSECGATKTEEIPATGEHNYVEVITKQATCKEAGQKENQCSVCHQTEPGSQQTIAKLAHTWDEGKITTSATCETEGVKTFTCSVGGETKTETLPATGHTFTDQWHYITAPTCTTAGTKAHICDVCGADSAPETVDALGHNMIKDASASSAPTCGKDGKDVFKCSRCDHTEETTLPATGSHTFVEDAEHSKAATCEEAGYIAHKCSVCGAEGETTTIPALGHTSGEWVQTTAPTCTEKGAEVKKCTSCGKTLETRETDALGHDYGEWTTTKPATCTTKGEEMRTCSRDGAFETRETDALGHAWDEGTVTTAPTCEDTGVKTHHCTHAGCTETWEETLEALGHKYEAAVTKEATCTAEGEMTYTCAVCGDHYTEAIAKLLHTPGAWEITREATCAEAGSRLQHCASCGETVAEEVIPATGNHTWTAWEPVPGDSTKEFRTCEVCHTQEEHTVELPAENSGSSDSTLTTGLKVLGADNANIIQNTQQVTLTQITSTLYVDAKQDTATLDGVLADLSALLASDVRTLVFSTDGCTSTLYLSELAALGVDETQFTLTHSGSSATLTVGGVQHNELIH